MNFHSSISEFDAFDRNEVLSLLVRCIAELPPTQKTVLAMYYHENLRLAEIATCVGLTECEIDQIRVRRSCYSKLCWQLSSDSLNFLSASITWRSMGQVSWSMFRTVPDRVARPVPLCTVFVSPG